MPPVTDAAKEAVGFEFPYIWAFIAFNFSLHLLDQYLEWRQLKKNLEKEPPEFIKTVVGKDTEEFLTSQAYQRDKRTFGMLHSWIGCFVSLPMLIVVNPYVWHWSVSIVGEDAEYQATLLWLFVLRWLDKPLEIPFSVYSNFVVEANHGFNQMTPMTFITDLLKGEALTYFFGGLLIPLVIWVVHWGGERFYLYLWAVVQVLIFIFMWIYPNYIQPLFNKFEALKDEDLKEKIEDLCATEHFPLKKLFQIDGSKRSSHSNAYFFGFWKNKRIVLYDTLLHLPHDDILAILCHELGHWKFGHIMVNLVIASIHFFLIFWLYGLVMHSKHASGINASFGYGRDNKAVVIGLMNFTTLLEPIEQLVRLGMTMRSRKHEFQADEFAVVKGRGESLKSGLIKIHKENKGELNPDPWYSWYHYSHPPLIERLRAVDAQESKKK